MSLDFRKCPVCRLYYSFKIKEVIEHDNIKYHYSVCHNCGYVMQNPNYDSKSIYYNLGYDSPNNYVKHAIDRANYIVDFILDHTTRFNLIKKYNILDIGSGKGLVGYYISERLYGSNVRGITYHEEDKYFIDTNVEDIENILTDYGMTLGGKNYDLIIMSHVLEHFKQPEKVLSYIQQFLLKDNGIIYIEVPSFYRAEVRSKKVFVPQHISFFTKKSLFNLLNLSGLRFLHVKESKHWGNIKCLATNNYYKFKFKYDKFVYTKYIFSKIINRLNKIIYRNKNVGPNE